MSWVEPMERRQAGAPRIPARGRVASGFAILMGIGSILMSYFMLMQFGYGVVHFAFLRDPNRLQGPSWRTLIFELTSPWWITGLTCWVGIAGGLGYAGYRIGRGRLDPNRPASLAATAARFSSWGMAGCALDLAVIAGMLAYRWTR